MRLLPLGSGLWWILTNGFLQANDTLCRDVLWPMHVKCCGFEIQVKSCRHIVSLWINERAGDNYNTEAECSDILLCSLWLYEG